MKKLILIGLLVLFTSSIHALTIEFSGTITSVIDPDEFIDDRITAGDTFTAWATYDFSSYTLIEHENLAIYTYSAAPNGLTVEINGFIFTNNPEGGQLRINVANDRPSGTPDVLSYISSSSNIFMGEVMPLSSISCGFYDATGTALSSLDLPDAPPVLSDYAVRNLNISRNADGLFEIGYTISGEINFTEVTSSAAIPEPTTVILCSIGFILLGRHARTKE